MGTPVFAYEKAKSDAIARILKAARVMGIPLSDHQAACLADEAFRANDIQQVRDGILSREDVDEIAQQELKLELN